MERTVRRVVIALAGRRIDAPDAETARFPLRNVPRVEQQLGELFARETATALVSSAACGADLVALTVAGRLRLRRRVVLPFSADTFKTTSVTDRPGDWGPVYDRLMADLSSQSDVVTLPGLDGSAGAYLATNHAILDEAIALARQTGAEPRAVIVWEGASRGSDDTTAAFAEEARERGVRLLEVRTVF
jgi:hypothetical protein